MSEIKVISFDLDNTLWDVNHVILQAEKLQRDWLRVHAPVVLESFAPPDMLNLRKELLTQQPELQHNLSQLRESVLFLALRRSGYREPQARRLAREGFDVFLHARHDVTYYDHALEVLEELTGNYILGALSNGNAEIQRLGLDRFFSFSFSAASVGVGKPDPAMFQAALSLNDIHASEMIHIGDHPIDDIQGAAQLGIHTLWINHSGEPYTGNITPSAAAESLREVPPLVAAMAAAMAAAIDTTRSA